MYSISIRRIFFFKLRIYMNIACISISLNAIYCHNCMIFSERELTFTFAICRRPSVCLSVVCLSVCHLSVCRLSSVTLVHPTQAIEIFGNVSTPFGTVAICDFSIKILWRSSQGNPSVGGLNQRGVEKYSDFGPFQGYISETVQDRR